MIEALELERWREAAACVGRPDVDFFTPPEAAVAVAAAKEVCATCPVLDDCLAFAIETNQPDGIWGGLTSKERLSVRRRWLEDLRRAS